MKTFVLLGTAVFLFGVNAEAGKKHTGKGPCKEGDQCKRGVCIEVNDDSYCSQNCGSCPAGMFCDDKLFSVIGLKVCVKGSKADPPQLKEPPRVPCKTDKQCPGALICAEMMGQRDCTIKCKRERQCKMPEMMGVKMDFMTCALDEGKRGRKACLPKKECLANPMGCMNVNPNTMGSMMEGTVGMANAMEEGMDHEPNPALGDDNAPTGRGGMAMSESRFKEFLAQVKKAGFEDERNAVLDTAAKRNYFTCDQVGRVVSVIGFGDEKISALRILAPKLVDKENSHTILARFTFDDEKQKARAILNR